MLKGSAQCEDPEAMTSILVRDVRIFDGWSVLYPAGSVLLRDGVILSVTQDVPTVLPEHTQVISGDGKTILPGLIDAHVHAGSDPEDLMQPLRFGVTTVLDMHNEPEAVVNLTKATQSSSGLADFRSACHAATIEGGWPAPVYEMNRSSGQKSNHTWSHIASPEDVEPFVKENILRGCSYIKLMQESGTAFSLALPSPDLPLQTRVVKVAHDHGLLAVGHATSIADAIVLLRAGVDGLMHVPHDGLPSDELINLFLNHGAFVTPTLATYCSGSGETESTLAFSRNEQVQDKLDNKSKEIIKSSFAFPGYAGKMAYAYEWVRRLKAAGVDIICGTDSSPLVPGTAMGASVHHELSLYINNCGFTPIEALRSATSQAAKRFKLNDRGRLAVGLRADLLLVDGDPATDIQCLLNVVNVWKEGNPLISALPEI